MAICVQAPQYPSTQRLIAVGNSDNLLHVLLRRSFESRLPLKERACLTEIRQAHLLYSQQFIGVVGGAGLAQPLQAKKLR